MATPQFSSSSRPSDLTNLLRPLPPALADAIAGDAAESHAKLREAFGEAEATVRACEQALAEARRSDADRAREAALGGRDVPKAKAAAIETKLEEARRQRAAFAEAIPESAARLLAAALPHAAQVADATLAEADRVEAAVAGHLQDALAALDEAAGLRGEAGWCRGLVRAGLVRPFTPYGASGPTSREIRTALAALEDEARRREENQAAVARHDAADALLPSAPGAWVSPGGGPVVAGEESER